MQHALAEDVPPNQSVNALRLQQLGGNDRNGGKKQRHLIGSREDCQSNVVLVGGCRSGTGRRRVYRRRARWRELKALEHRRIDTGAAGTSIDERTYGHGLRQRQLGCLHRRGSWLTDRYYRGQDRAAD